MPITQCFHQKCIVLNGLANRRENVKDIDEVAEEYEVDVYV